MKSYKPRKVEKITAEMKGLRLLGAQTKVPTLEPVTNVET